MCYVCVYIDIDIYTYIYIYMTLSCPQVVPMLVER